MKKEEIIHILQQFKHNNQNKYNILKIGIFGSVVRETNTQTSDIDIVVFLGKQDLLNIIGIKQELEDELYAPVDIVSYRDNMNRFLKQRIDNEAVYV
ncbi:MAG: nucleotidyltransferase domain-containing protein [Desulfobacterales bacterium]|nr:nucleotidyltransferase domain-containing protein [Desulfobacterales bacterium]